MLNFIFFTRLLLFPLIYCFSCINAEVTAQGLTYSEKTGDEKSIVNIQKKQNISGETILQMTGDHRDSRHYFEPDGYAIRWEHKDSKLHHNFEVIRTGNKLSIKGTFKGEPIDKVVEIDNSSWTNKIDEALSFFAKSSSDETVFWVLKLSSDMDPLKIKAEKVGNERLTLNNSTYETTKVKVTLDGFLLSKLWSAYYWYRKEDGLFLKYEGANGKPGTPLTTIQLESIVGK